jgi:hypothetical protein
MAAQSLLLTAALRVGASPGRRANATMTYVNTHWRYILSKFNWCFCCLGFWQHSFTESQLSILHALPSTYTSLPSQQGCMHVKIQILWDFKHCRQVGTHNFESTTSPHGVISNMTSIFCSTAVRISDLTSSAPPPRCTTAQLRPKVPHCWRF